MSANVYYVAEMKKYPEAQNTLMTKEQVRFAVKWLFQRFEVPEIPIYFSDEPPPGKRRSSRKSMSWFNHSNLKPNFFNFALRVNIRVVCHEVAHYLHLLDQTKRGVTLAFQKENGHGPEHAVWMKKAVDAYVEGVKEGAGLAIPQPKIEPIGNFFDVPTAEVKNGRLLTLMESAKKAAIANIIEKFRQTLPAFGTCPKCNIVKAAEAFGVRVMKKDAEGFPTILRRQSYCSSCR